MKNNKTLNDYLEQVNGVNETDPFEGYTRENLISLLATNDMNGIYTDEDNEAEGYDPLTRDEAIEYIVKNMEDNEYDSFKEWRKAALGLSSIIIR